MTQPDTNAILQRAQRMQAQLQAVQQEIVAFITVGEAGDGLVEVTVQGSGEVIGIATDPKAVDLEDADGLQDLALVASRGTTAKTQSLVEQEIGPLSQSFDGLGGLGF